uniref:Replicating protein n=1 Tax=Agrobacterium tumefaciens TaxID=358 RepID=REPA_AGRTU|nr:RecName: Full=Replicating protein [Agrobacterium tumefaciens]AAD15307.1 replication protein [Agrobacterium tumefaciens]
MFQQIGAVQAKSGTDEPAHPCEKFPPERKCEAVFWKPLPRHEAREILLAARKYELAMKQPGKRTGPLGHVALEVLDYLTNLVDFGNGRLDPSISTIMEKIGRAESCMSALYPNRQRGRRPAGAADKQRLPLEPAGARPRALLGKYVRKAAPLPDDAAQARQERHDTIKAHMDSLSPADRLRETVEDRTRAEQLAGYVERAAQNRPSGPRKAARRRQQSRCSFTTPNRPRRTLPSSHPQKFGGTKGRKAFE